MDYIIISLFSEQSVFLKFKFHLGTEI